MIGAARRAAMACALALTVFAAPAAAATKQEELTLSLPEVRHLAVRAALTGDTQTAAMLAGELLRADPHDPAALLAMSTVDLSFGNWDRASAASRRVFRTSDNREFRFHAARVAATSAVARQKLIPAQYWLRRAGDLAPTEVDRAKIERNFALLRQESPWRYRFNLSTTPSSNVNGGSDFAYNIIDGLPLVGILSPSAQKLSGLVTQGDVRIGYRFHRGERSSTELNAGLYVKRVFLSDESKRKAPTYDAGRLGATSVSVGLAHTMYFRESNSALRFETTLRDNWVAGDREYTALSAAATCSRMFFEKFRLTGRVEAERRFYTNDTLGYVGTAQVSGGYTFNNGDTLSALVSYTRNETPVFIFDSVTWVGKVSYSLGEPVLGVALSASVGASVTKYPDYTFIFFPVPGGRTDEGLFFDLDARFTQVEFAGFSPTLRVRRAVTDSNVSRFTTSEWSVSVGIQSNF